MSVNSRAKLSRRERKKGETRSKIIDIAMGLFRKQGFESTTMDQIAEETDVSKGTLYNYFSSKEAILHEYVQRGAAEAKSRTLALIESLPDTRSRLAALFQNVSSWMKANREIYKVYVGYRMGNLLQPGQDQSARSGFSTILEAVLAAGQKSGELRKDIPPQILSLHLEMMYFGLLICWLSDAKSFTFKKAHEQIINLFLEGAAHNSKSKG